MDKWHHEWYQWQPWHLKFLSFASAWWMLALPHLEGWLAGVGIPEGVRSVSNCLPAALPIAALLAVVLLGRSNSPSVQTGAGWFLLGVLSIPFTVAVGGLLFLLLALSGALG